MDWTATVQTTMNSMSAFRTASTTRVTVKPTSQQTTAHATRTRGVYRSQLDRATSRPAWTSTHDATDMPTKVQGEAMYVLET